VLAGLIGVMIIVSFDINDIYTGKTGTPPYSVITSFNIMLFLFILDRNVLAFIRRKASNRLPILGSLKKFFSKVTPAPYRVQV